MSEYPLLLPFIIGVSLEFENYCTPRLLFNQSDLDCHSNGGAEAFLCTKPSNYVHYAVALSESMQNQ